MKRGKRWVYLWMALLVMVPAGDLAADLKSDVGFTQLAAELGAARPTGAGVTVMQVEAADAGGHWMPDGANAQFSGKTITDKTGGDAGASSHATTVGTYYYGTDNSLAPGITGIDAYAVSTGLSSYYWLGLGYLMQGISIAGYPVQPMYYYSANPSQRILAAPGRVANHSWVGTGSSDASILHRLDFSISADEFFQSVAVNNGTVQRNLVSGAFNALTVGRTDGGHPQGTLALDAVYTAGRICPLIVVPLTLTSYTAPVVGSAAALLVQTGHAADLSDDPVADAGADRNGRVIYNAERAETIKAALMAGALRVTRNGSGAQISDYRRAPANRGTNGLDVRFGAGQLNIYNSYHIIAAGEQNSAQDFPSQGGAIATEGFDVDPAFGGLSGSNITANYVFTAATGQRRLCAALVWHVKIDGGTWNSYIDTATLYNLDLALYDTTPSGEDRLVAVSNGTLDNTENLWAAIVPGRGYRLTVTRAASQSAFLWNYALAWRMGAPPDSDGDGMDDDWEVQAGLSYTDPADAALDPDNDNLTNVEEYTHGTDLNNADSDGDGSADGAEVLAGSDPLDPAGVPLRSVPAGPPAVIGALLLLVGLGAAYNAGKK